MHNPKDYGFFAFLDPKREIKIAIARGTVVLKEGILVLPDAPSASTDLSAQQKM